MLNINKKRNTSEKNDKKIFKAKRLKKRQEDEEEELRLGFYLYIYIFNIY